MAGSGGWWEQWRRITSFPLLWLGLYACWVAFSAAAVFAWAGLTPFRLALAAFLAVIAIPPALLGLSQWMERHYHTD